MRRLAIVLVLLFSGILAVQATIFGGVRVLVHDPQHRAISGAKITIRNVSSGFSAFASSDDSGVVLFRSVPIGNYHVEIQASGFARSSAEVRVVSDRIAEAHFQLKIATVSEQLEVRATGSEVHDSTATQQTAIDRMTIVRTPEADRSNSLKFITDFVPGATVVHNQLHVRGGHQLTWALDGTPIPNTNISSNVGPQFDPKDIQFLEAQRGGFTADYGDRTYAVFNVAPRSGFERSRTGELLLSYGSYNQTDNHLSFGDHSERFAYYVSANGNRTDYGLEPPTFTNLHNQSAGGGLFTSLTYNARNGDQLRLSGAGRADFYQVPNDPEMQDAGVRDREREQDIYSTFTYLHPFAHNFALSLSPFFHFARAAFEGGPLDILSATDNRSSTYSGGQVAVSATTSRHNARIGLYAFAQQDHALVRFDDVTGDAFSQTQSPSGNLEALFLEDQFRPLPYLTFTAGARLTRFTGEIEETAASPRLGVAFAVPRVPLILRASYSRFYQAPPLSTITGPLLEFAASEGVGFLPLHGERDEQHDFGITVPLKGWSLDADVFRTSARNYFDHEAVGNSSIFFPLTIDRVAVQGTELSLRSPRLFGRADLHLVYSRQSIKGEGAITGGLTEFQPPEEGSFYLDHDQRDTLSTGFQTELPWRVWTAFNFSYGSGFLEGDGPGHLPSYHTFDVALGKSFGERWSGKVTAANLTNGRHFIDLSNTFGGSHVSEPRMVTVQLKYQFRY